MLHPIFSVLISKPELVMDHVTGYASLMREEASSVGKEVAKRAVAWGAALASLLLFLVLAGMAIMLGVMLQGFHWVLVVVPGVALGVAIVAFNAARKPLPEKAFTELKAQLEADAQALRAIRARS